MNLVVLIPSVIGGIIVGALINKLMSKKSIVYKNVYCYYGLDKMWHTYYNSDGFLNKSTLKQYINKKCK